MQYQDQKENNITYLITYNSITTDIINQEGLHIWHSTHLAYWGKHEMAINSLNLNTGKHSNHFQVCLTDIWPYIIHLIKVLSHVYVIVIPICQWALTQLFPSFLSFHWTLKRILSTENNPIYIFLKWRVGTSQELEHEVLFQYQFTGSHHEWDLQCNDRNRKKTFPNMTDDLIMARKKHAVVSSFVSGPSEACLSSINQVENVECWSSPGLR